MVLIHPYIFLCYKIPSLTRVFLYLTTIIVKNFKYFKHFSADRNVNFSLCCLINELTKDLYTVSRFSYIQWLFAMTEYFFTSLEIILKSYVTEV